MNCVSWIALICSSVNCDAFCIQCLFLKVVQDLYSRKWPWSSCLVTMFCNSNIFWILLGIFPFPTEVCTSPASESNKNHDLLTLYSIVLYIMDSEARQIYPNCVTCVALLRHFSSLSLRPFIYGMKKMCSGHRSVLKIQ